MGTCSPVSAASQTYLSFPPPGLKNLILSGLTVMAQVYHDKDGTKHHNMEGSSRDGSPVEKLEHAEPGYGHERDERVIHDIEDENPNVYHHMCFKLFTGLTAMSFCGLAHKSRYICLAPCFLISIRTLEAPSVISGWSSVT